MSEVMIDFDPRIHKLRITCPYWSNDLLSGIEAKNWSKAQKAWLVPISRATVDYINEKILRPRLGAATAEALTAMKDTTAPASVGTGFPKWYKFKTQPRKHQIAALQKYGLDSLALFMIMRAGKTKVVIDMVSALRMEGKIEALLVVCKLSVRRTWMEQFELHCPISYDIALPYTDREQAFDRWCARPHDFKVCVVGTESLSQGRMFELARRFASSRKCAMAIDESSMISNHKAERSKRCVELGHLSKPRMALTGTPTSEGPMNLFMQFEFLDTNIIGIGDFYAFRNRYAVMGGYRVEIRPGVKKPMQIVGYQNLEELTKIIAPYTVEIGEEQLDLPPRVYEKRHVALTEAQLKLYKQIQKERSYRWKEEEVVVKNVLELELRLHRLCGGYIATRYKDERGKEQTRSHPAVGTGHNPKMLELVDLIEELGPKKQGIIWCAYRDEIRDVINVLYAKDIWAGQIHGDVGEDAREEVRQAFQRGQICWIVANAATGSMGLDMSAASVEVFYSNTNKMIDRTQAEARALAEGKKTSVLIVDIIAEGTVDEVRMQAIEQKQDLSEYIRARLRECIAAIRGE